MVQLTVDTPLLTLPLAAATGEPSACKTSSRESSCVRRSRTNTPLQSLAMLNETQRIEMGRGFAERLFKHSDVDSERIDFMFTLLACRSPNQPELDACLALLNSMRTRYAHAKEDALALDGFRSD